MNPNEIKELRKEKKLTQEQLGEVCGVRNSSVSRWEKGVDSPSGPALKILQQLRDGDLVVSEVSDLEVGLLDQNVKVGGFKDREDYLTKSLKHLLVHGEFLSLNQSEPLRLVAEDSVKYGSTNLPDAGALVDEVAKEEGLKPNPKAEQKKD